MTDTDKLSANAAAQSEWPYFTRVHKKQDGLMVMYGPYILDFMHWHEGIAWRLTKQLPARFVAKRSTLLQRAGDRG